MKKTPLQIPATPIIDYTSNFLFLGSCFSENLSKKMKESGFSVSSNPFGVVYNPISLADFLLASDKELKSSVFEREGVSLSWLANSTCFEYAKTELQAKLIQLRQNYLAQMDSAMTLFVTLGTAWVYEHQTTHKIVANCHKAPKTDFKKRLLSVDEIVVAWKKVIETNLDSISHNSDLKIIFTVSPVRHIKDGLIENSQSKAILITAIHELKKQFKNVNYFPAYELMIDELRDYAYYTSDGIHPNEIAINEIWKRFKSTYFTTETVEIYEEYEKIRQLFNHRPLHPESKNAKEFGKERRRKLEMFEKKYPFIESDL